MCFHLRFLFGLNMACKCNVHLCVRTSAAALAPRGTWTPDPSWKVHIWHPSSRCLSLMLAHKFHLWHSSSQLPRLVSNSEFHASYSSSSHFEVNLELKDACLVIFFPDNSGGRVEKGFLPPLRPLSPSSPPQLTNGAKSRMRLLADDILVSRRYGLTNYEHVPCVRGCACRDLTISYKSRSRYMRQHDMTSHRIDFHSKVGWTSR